MMFYLIKRQMRFIIQPLNIENLDSPIKNSTADLTILEHIEKEPDTSQATLAEAVGVAVGTINWHLKRLIAKGYIKVKRAERKKLKYIITPEGIALRAKLLVDYIQSSMELYRLVRERSAKAIRILKKKGVDTIQLQGDGEVTEILKLTCHEQGIQISEDHPQTVLKVVGLKIFIEEPEREKNGK
jgi:DNA-binding MarR family transcriptional regulator